MNIQNFIETYHELPAAERKEGLSYIHKEGKLQTVFNQAKGANTRAALRVIADMGARAADFTKENIGNILKLLRSDDPKVRMHAAQIIGNSCANEYLDELIDAIMHEQTMFALPSYLLAIGSAKNDRAKRFLDSYQLRSDLEKHRLEEKAALSKALASFVSCSSPRPTRT